MRPAFYRQDKTKTRASLISHGKLCRYELGVNTQNTPGNKGGPGGRDRTLDVKSRKITKKSVCFFVKNKNYLKKNIFFAYIF